MSLNERKDKTGKIKEVPLNLGETETEALNEMRRLTADDAEISDLRDATLARYLRHNSWSVEQTIAQIREYLRWRKANNVDKILEKDDFPSKEIIRTVVPYAYHRCDKEGRPIYIEKTGLIATAALADPNICSEEHFMQSHMWGVENMQKLMYEQSLARGERVNGITTILDMNGLGFQHRNCLHVLKKCMDFDQKYYPEYLGKLYVINAPWVAPFLFQAVQVFLDEVTKSRIEVVKGDPSEFLLSVIDAENLPKEYGGTCDGVACRHGGLGDLYGLKSCADVLDSSALKAAEVSGLDAQEVSYDFEKLLASPQADGKNETFTWYFEVADGYDIDFSVELLPANGVREADERKRVFLHPVERVKTGKGNFKAPYPNAKLLLRWDNNFSYFTSKNLRYTCACIADESGSLDAILDGSSAKPATASEEQKSQ